MKINKCIILLLLTTTSLSFAVEQHEDQVACVEQQDTNIQEYDEFDLVAQEFDETELQTSTDFQEPSRIQVWATEVMLTVLLKYFEMRDAAAEYSQSASSWWRNVLVFCHLKAEKKEEDVGTSNEQNQA